MAMAPQAMCGAILWFPVPYQHAIPELDQDAAERLERTIRRAV